jgi:riboflavin synthase
MFTGLVQEVGTVESVSHDGTSARLRVATSLASDVGDGDSVLVNGVCLTAVATAPDGFEADLSAETLRRSALAQLDVGDRVNLELPLRAGDRLGGHMVQGHVDGVGEVRSASDEGAALNLRVDAPPDLLRYVVEKGSIALDGVSLTITDVNEREFGVSLIPETLLRTNLGDASPGRRVNLEVDVIAKYVEKLVGSGSRT